MITVTLQLQNAAQLAFLSAALERMNAEAEGRTETPVEEKPAKKSKPAAVTVAAVVETPAPEAEAPEAEAAPAVEYTLQQVRAKMAELTQAGKQDGVKKLLKKYGATNLTGLDPAHYAAAMAEAEAL